MYLETERLLIREWSINDLNDLVEGLNNLEITGWLAAIPHPYTIKDGKEWINRCIRSSRQNERPTSYHCAIELKEAKKVIGGLSLEKINYGQGIAGGGGIWINAHYQGQGFATEAFDARARFAFEELGLRKLENGFFKGNTPSLKMQERLGYKVEGLRRQSLISLATGKIHDEYITGLLKEEWLAGHAGNYKGDKA